MAQDKKSHEPQASRKARVEGRKKGPCMPGSASASARVVGGGGGGGGDRQAESSSNRQKRSHAETAKVQIARSDDYL
jgi:hypothetical protein|eukprot:COSAG06_NODE_1045_length_10977_cov_29.037323_8_plen_77_part_00